MLTGVVDGHLLVAGGCNFPEQPASEGGKKRYYDGIYSLRLNQDSLSWQRIGTLPQPLAYGAFVTWGNQLIGIGGQTPDGATDRVFALRLQQGHAVTEQLPSLPCTLDNAYAALLGEVLYVAGGNADGTPSDALFALRLDRLGEGWSRVATLPDGPRVQPVLAALDGQLYLLGGFSNRPGETPCVRRTAWRYQVNQDEWTEIAAPDAFVGGGCGVVLDAEHILCAGGVHADIFERAIRGEYPQPDYLLHPKEWYCFNRLLQCYNVKTGVWSALADDSRLARAGAGLVATDEGWILVQGEEKPGIRSPLMTCFSRRGMDRALPIVEQLPLGQFAAERHSALRDILFVILRRHLQRLPA